jgi:hypothetical protein
LVWFGFELIRSNFELKKIQSEPIRNYRIHYFANPNQFDIFRNTNQFEIILSNWNFYETNSKPNQVEISDWFQTLALINLKYFCTMRCDLNLPKLIQWNISITSPLGERQ